MNAKGRFGLRVVIAGVLTPLVTIFIAINLILGLYFSKKLETALLPNQNYIPSNIPGLIFTLPPANASPDDIGINPEGFRSRAFDPGFDGLKIMLVGDSISYGAFLLHYKDTLPGNLEKELGKTGRASAVYNLAIPAWSVSQKIAAFKAYEKMLEPDVLLFQTKPADFPYIKPLVLGKLERIVPLLAWIKYRIYRTKDHQITATAALEEFKGLIRKCNEKKIDLFVVMYPYLENNSRFTVLRLRDIEMYKKAGAQVIDLIDTFIQAEPSLENLRIEAYDCIHPNAKANRIAAKTIANELPSALLNNFP